MATPAPARASRPAASGHREADRRAGGSATVRAEALLDETQASRHVVGALPARVGVLGEALADEGGESGGHSGHRFPQVGRLGAEDGGRDLGPGGAGERAPARERLEEDAAEGEDVAARVRRPALHLLRGEVGPRPHERAHVGQRLGLGGEARGDVLRRRRRGGALALAGEAEVEELRPRAREHDVARLEVAVDDAPAVRRGEGTRELGPSTAPRPRAGGPGRGARRASRPRAAPSRGTRSPRPAPPRDRRRTARTRAGGSAPRWPSPRARSGRAGRGRRRARGAAP